MTGSHERDRILMVGQDPGLMETVRRAAEPLAMIEEAAGQAEAIEAIKSTRPDIVLLLGDELSNPVTPFHAELRRGWISRHSSVLLVKPTASGDGFVILDETYLDAELAARPTPPPNTMSLAQLDAGLRAAVAAKLRGRRNTLQVSLREPGSLCLIWEQIPGLGSFEKRQEAVLENARKAAAGGNVCAISVTDNPGGNPAIATEILSGEIRKLGVEPLVHVAFRDRSRNQCESLLYQLASMDINNLLVLTGDYPSNTAFQGTSRPVFDLDSVTGLELIAEMNRGMEHEIMLKKSRLAPTSFFPGVAFSPFKQDEAEVMGQYSKLKKKIEAGAGFIITQVGYDVRKLDELQRWLRLRSYSIPAVASIYVLSGTTARAMHDNHVPGCVVTDRLLAELDREASAPDKGRRARLERAAKMYAVARGLGYAGVSISGQGLPYESVEYIVSRGRELGGSWPDLVGEFDYPQPQGFYYFARAGETGLNADQAAPRSQKMSHPPVYYLSRAMHSLVFAPASPFFATIRGAARRADRSRFWRKVAGAGEYWWKTALYGCLNCGDCALHDIAYLCPVSQCPKNQRNGPCGGSYGGWCEVYPNEKKGIWVRAYGRMRPDRRGEERGDGIIPPCNWALWQTSSWLNYFLGRDHMGRVALKGIPGTKHDTPDPG
jgi:methylenetetrahydrofolate reductase (NADPH)